MFQHHHNLWNFTKNTWVLIISISTVMWTVYTLSSKIQFQLTGRHKKKKLITEWRGEINFHIFIFAENSILSGLQTVGLLKQITETRRSNFWPLTGFCSLSQSDIPEYLHTMQGNIWSQEMLSTGLCLNCYTWEVFSDPSHAESGTCSILLGTSSCAYSLEEQSLIVLF